MSLGTTMRTTASALPPGGKVTIMRIGLLGQGVGAAVCAWLATAATATAIAAARMRIERFTGVSIKCGDRQRGYVRALSPIGR